MQGQATPEAPVARSVVIERLRREIERERSAQGAAEDAFWAGRRGPLIEPQPDGTATVTFVWRGGYPAAVLVAVNRVTHALEQSLMTRIPASETWFLTLRLRQSWRGSYNFLPADERRLLELHGMEPRWVMRTVRDHGMTDPSNPTEIVTHGGRASVLSLEGATPSSESVWRATPKWSPDELRAPNGRRLWTYRAGGEDLSPDVPVVFCLDGRTWLRSGDLFRAADAIGGPKGTPSPLLVLIDTSEARTADLGPDGTMPDEIATQLVPWLRSTLGVAGDPARVTVAGESFGGLTALRAGLQHPREVGNVLAQSPSLGRANLPRDTDVAGCLRLTAGNREIGLVGPVRDFVAERRRSGFELDYVEYDGGHDMAWWREHWLHGIRELVSA